MVRLKLFILLVFIQSCKSKGDETPTLTIAVAANMQYAMPDLIAAFQGEEDVRIKTIVGSTGKLTAQINEGAPFDVLVAADNDYPMTLFQNGKSKIKPVVYGYGSLVIWGKEISADFDLNNLKDGAIRHISIPNPKTAPYGKAALQGLQNANIYGEIESKLVFGESVAQTNQFVLSGAANVGITSKSVVMSTQMQSWGTYVAFPDSLYKPIAQSVVPIHHGHTNDGLALRFCNFLVSDAASEILRKYGYNTKP